MNYLGHYVKCDTIAKIHPLAYRNSMATYSDVIFYSLIGGLFSLVGGILLLSREKSAKSLAQYATPFAAGALIAAVFMDLILEGIEEAAPYTVMLSVVIGIVLFYLLERFIHWFHHHHSDEESKTVSDHHDGSLPLIIVGDTIHNALDGVAIAASFLVSVPTGIITTVAVALHEIPQEIGDFGLMLHKGMSRKKVLLVNALSALATTVMAVLTFAVGSTERLPMGVLIGLSAGFLLYIAMSDVIPELHKHDRGSRFIHWQPVLMILGIIVVTLAVHLAHTYIDGNHGHDEEKHAAIAYQSTS